MEESRGMKCVPDNSCALLVASPSQSVLSCVSPQELRRITWPLLGSGVGFSFLSGCNPVGWQAGTASGHSPALSANLGSRDNRHSGPSVTVRPRHSLHLLSPTVEISNIATSILQATKYKCRSGTTKCDVSLANRRSCQACRCLLTVLTCSS